MPRTHYALWLDCHSLHKSNPCQQLPKKACIEETPIGFFQLNRQQIQTDGYAISPTCSSHQTFKERGEIKFLTVKTSKFFSLSTNCKWWGHSRRMLHKTFSTLQDRGFSCCLPKLQMHFSWLFCTSSQWDWKLRSWKGVYLFTQNSCWTKSRMCPLKVKYEIWT